MLFYGIRTCAAREVHSVLLEDKTVRNLPFAAINAENDVP